MKQTAGNNPLAFEVVGPGQSRHAVTMTPATYQQLSTGGQHSPAACIEAAFRFLLDREPKEAILARFDVTLISHYFPEFETRLPDQLPRVWAAVAGPDLWRRRRPIRDSANGARSQPAFRSSTPAFFSYISKS
ncbi:MAG TPA: hypothetical protein VFZ16_18265 [Hyphomicrobiaceae bacterium]|nr:hypothetical protein [Hyphomicrobiaceae bacterium]